MIEVRKAVREDMQYLAIVQTRSWKAAFVNIISANAMKEYADEARCQAMLEAIFDSARGHFYIALSDNVPCGEMFWCDGEMDASAEIIALHSLEETWGTGVGKMLMTRAMEDIQNKGKEQVYLWVFKENHRARKFYEKCGFMADGSEQESGFDGAVELKYVYSFGKQNGGILYEHGTIASGMSEMSGR